MPCALAWDEQNPVPAAQSYPAKLKPDQMKNEAMSEDEPRVHMNPTEIDLRGGRG